MFVAIKCQLLQECLCWASLLRLKRHATEGDWHFRANAGWEDNPLVWHRTSLGRGNKPLTYDSLFWRIKSKMITLALFSWHIPCSS